MEGGTYQHLGNYIDKADVIARLDRIEAGLLVLAHSADLIKNQVDAIHYGLMAVLQGEGDEDPGSDLDGNPNRPNRNQHEEL